MKWQECDTVEFKESLNELSSGEHGRSTDGIAALVSFANHKGGVVYYGVKNDGTVIGLTVSEKTLRDVATKIMATTDPQLIAEVRIEEKDGKTILATIIGDSEAKPHKYKNIPYLRSGSTTATMRDSIHTQMLASRPPNLDLTSRVVHGTSINDLSEQALIRLRELLIKRNTNWKERTDLEILSDLLLIENGELTYTAILLLGKQATISKYIPQAELRYLWYASDNDTQYSYHNRDSSSCQPIILQLDMILSEIKIKIINVQMGLFRIEVKEFEKEVLQEAILNAIMHRDYRIQSHIFIKHYPSRLEIISPGSFFGGVTPQNIIFHPPRYRNLRLANILAKVFAVQQAGQGVDIMFKEMVKRGQLLAYFEDKENVALTIPAGIIDRELFSFISRVIEKGILLNLIDMFLLQLIKNGKGLTKSTLMNITNNYDISVDKLNRSIERLIQENVIQPLGEKRGKKYFLSKEFYKDLGISGVVTKSIGPSKTGIEVTIKEHLKIHGTGKISDFLTALSIPQDDKRLRKRVSKVLEQMHRDGLIEYEPKRRWTIYWLKRNNN